MSRPAEKDFVLRLTRREFVGRAASVVGGVAVFGLAACGREEPLTGTDPTNGTTPRGGVADIAIGGVSTSENLDPAHTWNSNETIYNWNIYETLVDVGEDYSLTPRLAESWERNDNATEWTINTREGVLFHDGEPFTARDAAFTIERQLSEEVGSFLRPHWTSILDPDGIEVIDASTLVLTLRHPHALVPLLFTVTPMPVVREGTTDFTTDANGTGPFKLVSFTAGESWELERNPDYWRENLPYLEGIRGYGAPDSATRAQAVVSGDADFVDSVDLATARPVVEGNDAVDIFRVDGEIDLYIALDTRQEPFSDNRVRMALKLAMDRDVIIETAYLGEALRTADTPAPEVDPLYPPGLTREQNIEEARQLLSEAGYPDGLNLELHTAPIVGGAVDFAVAYAETVEPAGIRVDVRQGSADTYFEQIWNQVPMFTSWVSRKHPVIRVPQTLTTDADWQETFLEDSRTDELMAEALTAADTAAQESSIQEMLLFVSENEGVLNPGLVNLVAVKNRRLKGVHRPPGGGTLLGDAYLET